MMYLRLGVINVNLNMVGVFLIKADMINNYCQNHKIRWRISPERWHGKPKVLGSVPG